MTDTRHRAALPKLLAGSVIIELLVLRLATRTFVNVPSLDMMRGPLRIVAGLGRFAYFVAVVALAATAVWVARLAVRGAPPRTLIAASTPLLVVFVGLGARLGVVPEPALSLIVLGVLALLGMVAATGPRHKIPVVAIVIAALVGGGVFVIQDLGIRIRPEMVEVALASVGWLWVAWGVGAPLLLRSKPSHGALVVWAGVSVVTTISLAIAASPVDILVLWAFGLAGGVPVWMFGLAAGGLAATIVDGARRLSWVVVAGVVVVSGAGVDLPNSYQSLLLVTGVSLLLLAEELSVEVPTPEVQAARSEDHDVVTVALGS